MDNGDGKKFLIGCADTAISLISYNDEAMLNETRFWIEHILSSQRVDGNFGPIHLNDGKQDFWPNMIVLWILQSYYEYTNDQQILDFMSNYCHYLLTVPDEDFLYSYWENSRETAIGNSRWQENVDASAWPAYEIYPDSPWNYALALSSPFRMEKKALPSDANPFTLKNVPLRWKAQGRLVPEWQLDEYGLCGVLPYENAKKSDRLDEIILVPMGAARLRITAFPYTTDK